MKKYKYIKCDCDQEEDCYNRYINKGKQCSFLVEMTWWDRFKLLFKFR